MANKWMIGLWILFIGGSLLSGILEMQFLSGSGVQEQGVFEALMSPPSFTDMNPLTFMWTIVTTTFEWLQAFWDMLWWNYAFLTGGYSIIKWIVLYPLTIAFVTSIVLAIRGVGSN